MTAVADFLEDYDMTERMADYFGDRLDFRIDTDLPQRKMVELGEILGRLISMEFVTDLGERGFRSDLVSNCLSVFQQEIEGRLSAFRSRAEASFVENQQESGSWLNYVAG